MSQYAAEAVPVTVEPELAEYLDRQLHLIELAISTAGAVAIVTEVDETPNADTPKVAGAFMNVNQPKGVQGLDYSKNGLWGCMYNHKGELEWKRYLPQSN